ncbi:MAG: tRNA nucleotidyltransferase (CCA-adding enzyme) [Flavobacteriaceae bacterium]|jgi:tRNA nucleotidyltransferase (CCA-adding enzyme)
MNSKAILKLIPKNVYKTLSILEERGFEAYLVGGCVRDLILQRAPNDWDITTNANPEEIQSCFEKTVYENNFGTVAVVYEDEEDISCRVIEITPYRIDGIYTDGRRPDSVSFGKSLEEDLARRDFRINAIALDVKGILHDPFNGQEDIKNRLIQTVGNPKDRFNEDVLRVFRAVRFSAQLGFLVSYETKEAITDLVLHKNLTVSHEISLRNVSPERIRDEFLKLIDAPFAKEALIFSRETGILDEIIPEFKDSFECEQNGDHIYDVWNHLINSLEHATKKEYPLFIKISALFHDIGKPATRRYDSSKKDYTFYGHEVVGAQMTKKILTRLKFPREISEKIVKLVRWHMFFSDTDQISISAVRRMINNVGHDLIWSLMDVRICDRIGMGRPKEDPYRLRKYHAMIEQALRDPISVKQLAINGDIMIAELGMKPGKRMGWILQSLLEEVLEDPEKNTRKYLEEYIQELATLSDEELKKKAEKGKEKQQEAEKDELKKIRRKHKV